MSHAGGGTSPGDRIVFFGDSLVHRSDGDHGLLDLVRRGLERRERSRRFELVEAGKNGDRIADLKKRLQKDVLDLRPSAVVLYWDSDASDVDEAGLGPAQLAAVRGAYERDLAEVLEALERVGVYVIVTGPTLIGEKPRGQNRKDAQLDAYASLNRSLAIRFGARYLDTRSLFFAHEARGTADPLTEDGEHLSATGVRLVAREVLRALHRWLHREETDKP
jgi:lysophospholipase L1-like esterase